MNKNNIKSKGFIPLGIIIIVIIIIVVLLKVNVEQSVNSPTFKKNIEYVKKTAKDYWDKYFAETVKTNLNTFTSDLVNTETGKNLKKDIEGLKGTKAEEILNNN